MESSAGVPPEVQAAAERLGVPVETLLEHVQAQQQQQPTAPAAQDQAASGHLAAAEQPTSREELGTVTPESQAQAQKVEAAPVETTEQRLERELAESRQETQQVRRMAQVAEQGRVVGSSGGGVPQSLASDLPNLGMIEPGIRYEYLNGLITDEQLAEKVGNLQAALLKKHEGGAI